MMKVLVFNDDVTPMEFVATVLQDVFGKSYDEALKTLLEAHHKGQATCGVYPETQAVDLTSHATVLAQRSGHPLKFSCVDADPPG